MQSAIYNTIYQEYFSSGKLNPQLDAALKLIQKSGSIFFVGNGGSNSIGSHMMQDFAKIAGYKTYTFSDPSLVTCFSNDYGYENAMKEWLKVYFTPNDLLIAISSSGESKNILNAAATAKEKKGHLLTLSGFAEGNTLSGMGDVNFHLNIKNYGVVECFHQVILHILLDSLHENK